VGEQLAVQGFILNKNVFMKSDKNIRPFLATNQLGSFDERPFLNLQEKRANEKKFIFVMDHLFGAVEYS